MTGNQFSAARRSIGAPVANAMTPLHYCLSCDARLTVERLAERRNPDGTVTAWYLCSRCAKVAKITSTPIRMSPASPMYAP